MSYEVIRVVADDDGQRLDRWLKKMRPDWPYVLCQKLLRKGAVKIDGKRAKSDARLVVGQEVRLPFDDQTLNEGRGSRTASDVRAKPEDRVPDILYEDDDILVLNKPTGLPVQAGSGIRMHLEIVMEQFAHHNVAPRLVHRLDRDTSGVMVMARTAAAARALGQQFKGRDVKKTYWALVSPPPEKNQGMIDAPIMKVMSGPDLERMVVAKNGDPAQTGYRVLHSTLGLDPGVPSRTKPSVGACPRTALGPDPGAEGQVQVALLECSPRTGRTHQIRVHAKHIGSPLLGDHKYDGNVDILKRLRLKPRVMLHAARLQFTHPKTGAAVDISAPMPDDMAKVCRKLKLIEV